MGSWLVPALAERGARVVGLDRPGAGPAQPLCDWLAVDLRDGPATRSAVARVEPEAVVHLAALAVPRDAAAAPTEALRANYGAVAHLLDAVADGAPRARVLLVSTGQVYRYRALDAAAAREDEPTAPANLYAATKLAAEQLGRLAARDGTHVTIARPFNHTGPGRPAVYAESSFARQVARLEKAGDACEVEVGNLTAVRDFSDVRDVTAAYALLLERGEAGATYNVCSGRGCSLQAILDTLIALARVRVDVRVSAERFEAFPAEAVASVGDPAKLRALGWAPEHALEDTLAELLDDWRSRL